ncbi:thermonuclease family protein [Cohaesibacter intestini]|uniref:thermonuclease family protein n=1 Tax=Cohaesibacter intestini TaxID=2211145 RepID=UPI000DE8BAFF|nr:hypothetical protein [Cohaesibacter intestini]
MPRRDDTDPYAAFAPSLPKSKGWQARSKLVRGMAFFTFTLLLSGLVFWLLNLAFGPTDASDTAGSANSPVKPAEIEQSAIRHDAPSQTEAETENAQAEAPPVPKLQGPDAGQIVAPPSRNVTPNFQLSPLHQAKPLTRAVGKALPPPPKLPPLPLIFRKVGILGPNRLVLITKQRSQSVTLSHVTIPDPKALCSFGGRKVPCYKMGKTALSRFIRGRAVGCIGLQDVQERTAKAGSQTAQCFLGSGLKSRLTGDEQARVTDLAAWMVRYGWVVPDDGQYQEELADAKRLKRGLYAPAPTADEMEALRQQQAESEALALEIDTSAAATVKQGETAKEDEQDLSLFSGDVLAPDQVSVPVLP